MKWIKVIVTVGYLSLSNHVDLPAWGQTQRRTTPVDGTALVEGRVLDAQSRQPIVGATISARSKEGTMRAQQVVTPDGSYQLVLDPKQTYIVTTKADGYESLEEPLTFTVSKVDRLTRRPTHLYRVGTKPPGSAGDAQGTIAATTSSPSAAASGGRPAAGDAPATTSTRVTPPKTLDAKVTYTPPLVVAPTGKATQLRAVQFVQSKAELLPDAQPALEQLLDFMNSHPTAEIELAGHTDNQGNFDENVKLSKQRVDLVKDYLVKNGIAASRISTRGYGPTRPIASNNSETTRQLNRRVEMTVLKQ
ncbi:OmpA family protein [Spirosoma fluminis]